MAQSAPRMSRAERTRSAILQAAEDCFAERGFSATRLEDVAAAVGIRRASIVYHFRDKRELYEAVLVQVLDGLRERVQVALAQPGPLVQRIEAGVAAWVDYVGERPSLARLLLREVADASPEAPSSLRRHLEPLMEVVQRFRDETRDDPLARAHPIEPVHLASAVVGSTVFFVAAMPALVPGADFDPLGGDSLKAHRREVLRLTRRLLGAEGGKV